jgi:Glycosyltransferase family 87
VLSRSAWRHSAIRRERFDRVRAPAAIALAVICTIIPFAGQLYGDRAGGWLMVDFRAYYCAAFAQREGANPYFAQPLHECESSTPAPYYRAPSSVTVPAPYPPYVLAVLAPLTLLPFAAAAMLWWILLAVGVGLSAYSLARITGQPILVAWAALVLSLGLTSFTSGNIVPLAMAAIVVAALCAQRGRLVAAAIAVATAMVEPQIALPAAVALFVGYSPTRLALAVAFALLGIISVASGGLAHTLVYVTAVLPAHALSEVSRDNQYSFSTVAAALGVPDRGAVLAGGISYILMGALGVVVGLRLAARYGERAFTLLVPPAFVLLGGSFVHTEVISAAVPAALLLFTRAQPRRGWLLMVVVLLAVPWMLATSAALFLAPLFPAAYLTYALWRPGAEVLTTALFGYGVVVGLFILAAMPSHAMFGPHAYPPIDPRLAEASWRQFVLSNSTNRPVMWLLRLPTWVGLIALAVGSVLNGLGPVGKLSERLLHAGR